LRKKIELYQSHNIPVYFGGTLFEAFLIRNQFDDYIAMLNRPGVMVDIKPSAGVQDLYFVFKNPKAKPLEPIVSLKDIQFNQ
jgi:phosphosulfolactate synthase (CoM biosynthesis protein A)